MLASLLAKAALVAMLADPAVCGDRCLPVHVLEECVGQAAPDSTWGEVLESCREADEQRQRELLRCDPE